MVVKNPYTFTPSRVPSEIEQALQKIKKGFGYVDDRLETLEYVAISISTLTGGSTVEVGTTVTTVTLNWTLAGSATVTAQTLTDTTLNTTVRTKAFTGLSLTTDKTYTLAVTDLEGGTDNDTEQVLFRNYRWWGTSASTSLTSGDILTLANSEFETDYVQTRNFDASAGVYLYFAWPTSFGASPAFTVNGLPDSSWVTATVSHTNASGDTRNFDTWRSLNLLNGSSIDVVVS